MLTSVLSRNAVTVRGAGSRTLVFSHGFGCDQNMWRLVVPAFVNDCRVVLYDHTGAGNSDLAAYSSVRHASLNGYADDLIEILEELASGAVDFVGHSVSAMIGALAAIRRPELFRSLIMVGPSACYINDETYQGGLDRDAIEGLLEVMDSNYLGWASSTAPAIMGRPDRPELGEELTASFCRTEPAIARQFARVTFLSDHRDDMYRVQTPTLVLQCSDDFIAPETAGLLVHMRISGSTMVQLKAQGHCPHLSAPEETIEAIRSWISRD